MNWKIFIAIMSLFGTCFCAEKFWDNSKHSWFWLAMVVLGVATMITCLFSSL